MGCDAASVVIYHESFIYTLQTVKAARTKTVYRSYRYMVVQENGIILVRGLQEAWSRAYEVAPVVHATKQLSG